MNKIIYILLFFGRMFGLFPKPSTITAKIKIKSFPKRQTLVKFRIKWFHPIVLYSLFFIFFSFLATVDNFHSLLLPTISQMESSVDVASESKSVMRKDSGDSGDGSSDSGRGDGKSDTNSRGGKTNSNTDNQDPNQFQYHDQQDQDPNLNEDPYRPRYPFHGQSYRSAFPLPKTSKFGGVKAVKILSFFNNFLADLFLRIGAIYMCHISSKLILTKIQNLLMDVQPPPSAESERDREAGISTISASSRATTPCHNKTFHQSHCEPEPMMMTMQQQRDEADMSKSNHNHKQHENNDNGEKICIMKYITLSTILVIVSAAIQMWSILQREVIDRSAAIAATIALSKEPSFLPTISTTTTAHYTHQTFSPTILFVNDKVQMTALVFAGIIPILSLTFAFLFIIVFGLQLLQLYQDFCLEVTRRFNNVKIEPEKNDKDLLLGSPNHDLNCYENNPGVQGTGWQAHFEEFNYGVDTQPKRKLHPYPPPHPFAPQKYYPKFIPQSYPYICEDDYRSTSKYWNNSQVHPHQPKHSVFMVAKIANSTMKWGARAKARCAGASMRQMSQGHPGGLGLDCNGNPHNGLMDPRHCQNNNNNNNNHHHPHHGDEGFEGIVFKFDEITNVFERYTQVAGFYSLIIVCSAGICLVENVSWMALEGRRAPSQKYVLAFLQSCISLTFILMIANFGDFLRSVIRTIRLKLQTHAVQRKDVGQRERDLISWITAWDFQFHASHLFNINRSLIPRVLGTAMISFLIILQLQILDTSSASADTGSTATVNSGIR